MTDYYVDSAGSDTSTYDTWAKAANSIATVDSLAVAGDRIFVASSHSETSTGILTFANTHANPVLIISADKTSGEPPTTYTRGASIDSAASARLVGSFQAYGIDFTNDWLDMTQSLRSLKYFYDCTVQGKRIWFTNIDCSHVIFDSCTVKVTETSAQWGFLVGSGVVEFLNCDIQGTGTTPKLFKIITIDEFHNVKMTGCDLSDWDVIFTGSSSPNLVRCHIANCQMKSGWAWSDATTAEWGRELIAESCAVGTPDATQLGLTEHQTMFGKITSVTSEYRTGGADDGVQVNEHSWKMDSSVNEAVLETYLALKSQWNVRWVAGGSSITLTWYVASGGTLNDDDFWIEYFYPDTAATSSARHKYATTRADPLATPVALTTDSASTWSGSGVGTKQKISATFTPDIAGPVKFRACLAKPATTVYFDPYVDVV